MNCWYCGRGLVPGSRDGRQKPNTKTKDHLIPRCGGGTAILNGNQVWSCMECNQAKANMTLEEYRVICAYRRGLLYLDPKVVRFKGES